MKKILIFIVACCFIAVLPASAQESVFTQDDNVLNLGVGFGGTLYSGYSSNFSRFPAITLSYERCIIDNLFDDKSAIGVGGIVGYTAAKYDIMGYGWKATDILIGGRGAFHYAFVDKLDTYAGFMIGYNIHSVKWTGDGLKDGGGSSSLTYGFFAGARYYFADNIGAFAEVGYGYSIFNVGLTFKF